MIVYIVSRVIVSFYQFLVQYAVISFLCDIP